MGANRAKEQKTLTLKLLVDKEKNQVIFAEADKDFVDVLFSFLTLPMGTVTRLLSKQSQPATLGCMNNLNRSVETMDVQYFQTETCKEMLVNTRNSAVEDCRKLKVNIDNTEPTKYYICSSWSKSHISECLSTFRKSTCGCGQTLFKEIPVSASSSEVKEDVVFVKAGMTRFLISDDLQVMPFSTATTFGLLDNLGIKDTELLEKKTIAIGLEEVLLLLKHSLLSKEPLTNTFLDRRGPSCGENFKRMNVFHSTPKAESCDFKKISLKVIVRKSNNKTIYAEAGEDFVSFLFSVLSFPLGAIVKLLDNTPSMGCITNLYKSVEGWNFGRYIMSEDHKTILLSPKLSYQYGCTDHSLGITQIICPSYFYNYWQNCYGRPRRHVEYNELTINEQSPNVNSTSSKGGYSANIYLVNPKSPVTRSTTKTEGYVKGPALFMVTDDLFVKPLCSFSAIALLEQLKVPVNDSEEREMCIGHEEALRILEASMTSNAVLTAALNYTISTKKPKQEKF